MGARNTDSHECVAYTFNLKRKKSRISSSNSKNHLRSISCLRCSFLCGSSLPCTSFGDLGEPTFFFFFLSLKCWTFQACYSTRLFAGARDCWLAWLPPNAVPLCRSLRVPLACLQRLLMGVSGFFLAFLAYRVPTVPRNYGEKTKPKITPCIICIGNLFCIEPCSLNRTMHLQLVFYLHIKLKPVFSIVAVVEQGYLRDICACRCKRIQVRTQWLPIVCLSHIVTHL